MSNQATATIDQPTADEQNPEELAAIAAAEAAGEPVRDLAVESVAPDPENAKSRLNPDEGFVASIKLRQLSPGVVVRLAVWADQGNDPHALYLARAEAEGIDIEPAANDAEAIQKLAEAIEKAKEAIEYVIVWGHRRWAAAKAAGNPTYRAVVTENVKDRVTKRLDRIMENVHRDDLTPLEEAHEYQRLIKEDGLSQRELNRRTGIDQSIISRRVALLKLPKQAQAALDAKEITIEVANALITFAGEPKRVQRVLDVIEKMPNNTDEEKEARTRAAKDAAQTEARAAEAAKAQTKKRNELKKQDVPLIEDPKTYFQDRREHYYSYSLAGDAIEKARANGTAVAYVANGGRVEWYTTEERFKPAAKPTPEVSTAEDPAEDPADPQEPQETDDADRSEAAETGAPAPAARKTAAPQEPQETDAERQAREDREREAHEIRTATMAREVACLHIANRVPSRDQLTARFTRRLLLGEGVEDLDAQKLTIEWLRAAGVIPAEAAVYSVFGDKDDRDPKMAIRAAYVFDLAIEELRTRASVAFDTADVQHIERLTKEAGYEPTPWEEAQIMKALNITT